TQSKNNVRPESSAGHSTLLETPLANARRLVVLPESAGPSYTMRTTSTPLASSMIAIAPLTNHGQHQMWARARTARVRCSLREERARPLPLSRIESALSGQCGGVLVDRGAHDRQVRLLSVDREVQERVRTDELHQVDLIRQRDEHVLDRAGQAQRAHDLQLLLHQLAVVRTRRGQIEIRARSLHGQSHAGVEVDERRRDETVGI